MTYSLTRTLYRRVFAVGLAATALGTGALSWAQTGPWTPKTVQITVPFPPGGGVDILARLISNELQKQGMTTVVDNKPGAGGTVAVAYVAARPGDGTALLMMNDSYSLAPAVYPKLGYDPRKDIAPVIGVAYAPMLVLVPAQSPYKTLGDLVSASLKAPLNWGSCGAGTDPHLAGEMLNQSFKMKNVHVPYKGCGPALVDTLGGQLDFAVVTISGALQYVNGGRMRGLAITSAQRSPVVPNVPTVAESGAPGFHLSQWQGLAVPGNTPEDIKQKIFEVVAGIVKSSEINKKLLELGYTPAAETPAQFTKVVHTDIDRFAALAKQLNLKID
jgi:tripartite-type tricarboxylate transporter receptor subunit TctC